MSRQLDRSNTDPLRNGNVYKGSRNQEYGINSSHNHVNIQNLSNGGISDEELSTLNSFSRQSSTSGQRPMINLSGIPSRIHVQPVEVLSTSMPPTFSASGKLASLGRNKSVSAANRPLDEIGNIRRPKPVPSQNELSQSTSSSSIPKSPSAQGYRYSRTIYDNAPSVLGRSDGRIHMLPRSAIANAPLPLKQHPHDRSESRNATNHAQSDSTASNQSENSQATTSSSRSSPPTSNASLSPRRYDNQDLGNSALKYEVERERIQTGSATRSFSRPSYARPTIPILSPETFEQVTAGPWQSELKARPREAPKPLDIRAAYHINGPFRDDPPHPPAPEFPKDSALKDNSLPIVNTRIEFPLVAPDFQEATRSAMMPTTERYGIFQDTLASSPPPRPTLRRAATTSKGRCRGCSEIITGKSVSSADGRLTGRWHKQCFTCKTCAEPFPTMDFYVIGNDPYCNRHYHRLNKSLCSSCDRGIEGQYVDNDQRKFHPHCFTCSECHLILRDTYFDLNGKIFCEQHAFKLDALPSFGAAGRRYPEKRATRLMRI